MTSRRHGSLGNLNLDGDSPGFPGKDSGKRTSNGSGKNKSNNNISLLINQSNNESSLGSCHKLAFQNTLNLRIQRKLLSKQVLINDEGSSLSSSTSSSCTSSSSGNSGKKSIESELTILAGAGAGEGEECQWREKGLSRIALGMRKEAVGSSSGRRGESCQDDTQGRTINKPRVLNSSSSFDSPHHRSQSKKQSSSEDHEREKLTMHPFGASPSQAHTPGSNNKNNDDDNHPSNQLKKRNQNVSVPLKKQPSIPSSSSSSSTTSSDKCGELSGSNNNLPSKSNKPSFNSSSSSSSSTSVSSSMEKKTDEEEDASGETGVSSPVIKLPENLEGLIRADHFPSQRHRWNTNEEIAAILISFARHPEWLSKEVKIRPKSGSMLLYSRKKVRYRRDGYCWKKRKDGKTTREDHMKLKVQGTECIYGCYVHSAILPTFHRRCYWLLQNPDIVLVHYLNVPYPDDNKLIITSNVSMWGDKKEWTKDELISQLKPMFFSEEEPDLNNELEISTAETVEAIVLQLMEKQRLARQNVVMASSTGPGGSADGSSGGNGLGCPTVIHTLVGTNTTNTTSTPSVMNSTQQQQQQQQSQHGSSSSRLSSTSSTASLVQMSNIPAPGGVVANNVPNSNNSMSSNPSNIVQSSAMDTSHGMHSQQQQSQGPQSHHVGRNNMVNGGSTSNQAGPDRPFVLNLSQFQTAGGLIILNGKPAAAAAAAAAVAASQASNSVSGATSVQAHSHHLNSSVSTVQNINTSATMTTSTLTASLMDIQNANSNACESSSSVGINAGSMLATSSAGMTGTNQQQTLFIHQQQHFAASVATKVSHHPQGLHQHHPHHHAQQQQIHSQQHHHQLHHSQQQQHVPNPGAMGQAPSGQQQNGDASHHDPQPQPPSQSQHQQQQQQQQQGPGQQGNNAGYFHQETLDMSHEDIQRTLSANMNIGDTAVDLVPMSPSADDVFVNLDAFDILADLSDDLDQHNHNGLEKNTIVDINPEWAYSEGGTKILIVGQFNNPHWEYSVHFGDLPVPAVYLQAGVLKCFCPPHSPGLVPIRVYSNGKQISINSMVFEYKADARLNLVPVPPSDTSLKLCLIHRMECLEKCFRNFKGDVVGTRSLEDCMVKICCEMMAVEWSLHGTDPNSFLQPCDRGLSLLHAAAALGYTRLVFTLIQWKRENPSTVLDLEINPLKLDDFGLTPLMWCARYGHLECGIILAQWSPESLQKRDTNGLNPVQTAVARGFVKFASELEKIQSRTTPAFPHQLDNEDFTTSMGNMNRFQRSASSVSEDFGLKDCFFGQPDTTLELSVPSEEESRVLTLAEQIIAAMPDRIKKESNEEMSPCESQDSSSIMSSDPSEQNEFSFELSDRNYRYYDSGTPCSSLSPSSSCLQSPCSSSFTVDSPQPTTADFCEFLQASAFEKDFSNLTLSDREQRELYEAAKVIQKAYRSYKGRKKLEEEEKEKAAAVIIQNYYRRYKQYAYLRQVTQAALVIQNQYRNYCENKRFKKSQESETTGFLLPRDANVNNNPASIMRSYSQRRQHQAARKIQQFMRQSKNNLWDPMHSPKATERACRKREATMSVAHGAHCPAPAKIALSSAVQHQHQRQQQQQTQQAPIPIQESNSNNSNNINSSNNNNNNYYPQK